MDTPHSEKTPSILVSTRPVPSESGVEQQVHQQWVPPQVRVQESVESTITEKPENAVDLEAHRSRTNGSASLQSTNTLHTDAVGARVLADRLGAGLIPTYAHHPAVEGLRVSIEDPHSSIAPRRANSAPVGVSDMRREPDASFFASLLQPHQIIAEDPTWTGSVINTVKYSWLNVLLIFIPVSWATHFAGLEPTVVFVFSFISIIPLAALLGFATEELAIRVGPTLGGLLNATFGNAQVVELIIAILALVKGELRVVQSSMIGSILSNCLLVLGMCFFAGGIRFHEQGYGIRAAQLNISLLSISVFSILIPAAFHVSVTDSSGTVTVDPSNDDVFEARSVLAISRGTSIILLVVYAAYLIFQLWTHAYLYTPEASAHASRHDDPNLAPPVGQSVFRLSSIYSHSSSTSSSSSSSSSEPGGPETHEPKLKSAYCFLLLVAVTVVTGITAEWLVDSIGGLTESTGINREFVALILLPLVGNAAEHSTAVTVSVKNKLDLAITVAVGSSIQIALFVIPFLVLLGWVIGQPLSLFFDTFETVIVFSSVLIVNYAIGDGKTNWLEGFVLMVIYVLIGLAVWYYPGSTANLKT